MGRSVTAIVVIMHALLATPLCAEEDPARAAGQAYLDKLALAVKDRAPFEELIGVYHGRKWVSHYQIQVSRASPQSGGLLQMTVITAAQIEGHAVEELTTQILALGWRPVRIEARTSRDGAEISSMTTAFDGDRWKSTIHAGGKSGVVEGKAEFGSCFTAIHLPWLMPPDHDMRLVSVAAQPETYEFECPESPHRARVGDHAVEYRRVRLSWRGREHHMLIDASGRCVEIRSFNQTVVRFRPIREDQIGKDLEGPLDCCASQQVLVQLMLARQRGDEKAYAGHIDFEAMTARQKDWASLSTDDKRAYVDLLRKKFLDHVFRNSKPAEPTPEEKLTDVVLSNSFAIEDSESAVVQLYDQVYKLHCKLDEAGEARWLIIGVEGAR